MGHPRVPWEGHPRVYPIDLYPPPRRRRGFFWLSVGHTTSWHLRHACGVLHDMRVCPEGNVTAESGFRYFLDGGVVGGGGQVSARMPVTVAVLARSLRANRRNVGGGGMCCAWAVQRKVHGRGIAVCD